MAVGAWQLYDSFIDKKNDGTMSTASTGYKIALFTSSYAPSLITDSSYGSISGEVAAGNGYTSGGEDITVVQDSTTNGQITVTGGSPSFTAAGGSIVFRYAVIYNENVSGTPLVAYCVVDDSPADTTIADSESLYFDLTTNGIFNEVRQ